MAGSGRTLSAQYTKLMGTVNSLGILAGFCYTQFADTYQEANGLLYADRRPKFSIEEIARATRGDLQAASPDTPSSDTVAPGPEPVPVTIGERPE